MVTDEIAWQVPMPGLTMPVPPETVAVLRLPVSIDGAVAVTRVLEKAYGPGLVIRTDAGLDGWMVVARSTTELDTLERER